MNKGMQHLIVSLRKLAPCNQYTEIVSAVQIEYFQLKKFYSIFLIFAQNIDCGYTLEPH